MHSYKIVSVQKLEHRFQLVEFGGRFCVELCLTFGCDSHTLLKYGGQVVDRLDHSGLWHGPKTQRAANWRQLHPSWSRQG